MLYKQGGHTETVHGINFAMSRTSRVIPVWSFFLPVFSRFRLVQMKLPKEVITKIKKIIFLGNKQKMECMRGV